MEKAWSSHWLQKALTEVHAMLDGEDLRSRHAVISTLLCSAMLQPTGANLQQALAEADEALTIAVDLGLQEPAA